MGIRDILAGKKEIPEVLSREMALPELAARTRRAILVQTEPKVADVLALILEGVGIKAERRVELYFQLVRLGLVEGVEGFAGRVARPPKADWRPGKPTKDHGRTFKVLGGSE